MLRGLVIAGIVAGTFLAAASMAVAAPKPKPISPLDSIALVGTPALGNTLSFNYVLVENVKSPRIQVVCTQDSGATIVYAEAKPANESFTLGGGSSLWLNDGTRSHDSAQCVATLYEWDFQPVQTFVSYAVTSFTAAGK
jgi:hypothetical protein